MRAANPLSPLSRLKILDNLRRSLVPASLRVLLLLGWSVLVQPRLWTLAVLAALFVPVLLGLVGDLLRKPDPLGWRAQLSAAGAAARASVHARGDLACDAALRGVVQHRCRRAHAVAPGCLAQGPARVADRPPPRRRRGPPPAQATSPRRTGAWRSRRRSLSPRLALAFWRPEALPVALPVLLLWAASPAIVWWLNQPLARRQSTINEAQALYLRLLSRRTWLFFETFVGPQDNHLPPDNVQEQPVERIAHRTSPTNIGLSLLATLTARDFGYVTTGELIERTAATLDAMVRMERHRGHWFNWYDTQTLQPLRPAYVSSVDSGNLAGHLLTLRAASRLMADEPPHATAAARHGGHTGGCSGRRFAAPARRRRSSASRARSPTHWPSRRRRPQNCARACAGAGAARRRAARRAAAPRHGGRCAAAGSARRSPRPSAGRSR